MFTGSGVDVSAGDGMALAVETCAGTVVAVAGGRVGVRLGTGEGVAGAGEGVSDAAGARVTVIAEIAVSCGVGVCRVWAARAGVCVGSDPIWMLTWKVPHALSSRLSRRGKTFFISFFSIIILP